MGKLGKREQLRQLPRSPAFKATVKVAQEGHQVHEGRLQTLSLNLIDADPEQPRTRLAALGLTVERIRAHAAGELDVIADNPEAQEAFDDLQGLAASIEEHGLLQPITVYPAGDRYVIAQGERRVLAHLLLMRSDIRASVRPRSKSRKRIYAAQLAENLAREDLSLSERVMALTKLDQLHREEAGEGEGLSAEEVSTLVGVNRRQAFKYLAVVRGGAPLHHAIETGWVTTLSQAAELAGLDAEAIKAKLASKASDASAAPRTTSAPASRGRPTVKVSLGSTTHPAVIQALAKSYLGETRFNALFKSVEWSDLKAVTQAWSEFLKVVEEAEG